MKLKTNYCLTLIGVFIFTSVFTSCNKENELIYTAELEENSEENIDLLTRALSSDEPSVSNPTLHTNWENVKTLYLNGGGQVDAPWVVKAGNSMNIPESYRTDILKEDGWEMAGHTLLNQNSKEPNYILLYNRYRGIIKGFYYNPTNISNRSFLWTLESNSPSSVIPPNTKIQGILNSTSRYATTSNIVTESTTNFGQLNQGWNAFSYELIYGTTNNNPIINISGYNSEYTEIAMTGTYSGEVVIPEVVTQTSTSGFQKIFSVVSSVAKVVGTFIPPAQTITGAISTAGAIVGAASSFTSTTKTDTIYTRCESSGTTELAGSFTQLYGGAVTSINNIDLKRVVNKDLGLWNLTKKPEVTYGNYQRVDYGGTNQPYDGFAAVSLVQDLKSLIQLNPSVSSEIKSYRVANIQYFTDDPSKSVLSTNKATEDCYFIPSNFKFLVGGPAYPFDSDYAYIFVYTSFQIPINLYVNVTVEFEYKNGSKFLSSRNYEVTKKPFNNSNAYDIYKDNPFIKVIYI